MRHSFLTALFTTIALPAVAAPITFDFTANVWVKDMWTQRVVGNEAVSGVLTFDMGDVVFTRDQYGHGAYPTDGCHRRYADGRCISQLSSKLPITEFSVATSRGVFMLPTAGTGDYSVQNSFYSPSVGESWNTTAGFVTRQVSMENGWTSNARSMFSLVVYGLGEKVFDANWTNFTNGTFTFEDYSQTFNLNDYFSTVQHGEGFYGAGSFRMQGELTTLSVRNAIPDADVPEPGTLILVTAGLVALAGRRHRSPWVIPPKKERV